MTRRIPAAQVGEVWPAILPLVEAALRHGGEGYSAGAVRAALDGGEWQLWGDGRSIACTRIAEYPAGRVLFVTLASGGLESVGPMWDAMKAFGAAHGCRTARAMTRPGWTRSGRLPPGWRHTQDIVTVEL